MPQNPYYVPTKLSDRAPWALNLRTLIAATPTAYGLIAGDATAITAAVNPYLAAQVLVDNPATRTPVTVASRDSLMAAMLAVVTPYMVAINSDPAVSDALKIGVGGTARITTKTRNSVVAEESELTIDYTAGGAPRLLNTNPATPTSTARPIGATMYEFQVQTRTGPTAPWTPYTDEFSSRPYYTLDPELFDGPPSEYRIRSRWIGALLPGGGSNAGPWCAYQPLVF